MKPVRQDNPAAFWASPLAENYPILHAWPKISKCPSNIGLGWTLVQCCWSNHKGPA